MHMVSISDNTASDALLALVGGPPSVSRRIAELGVGNIRVDRSEKQMTADLREHDGVKRYAIDARDTATPDAMLDLLVAFWNRRDGLTKDSHDLLMQLMTQSQTGKRRIKAGVPGATVAHKTGSMPGTANDVALITSADGKHHVAIAVFTKASKRDATADAEDDIAAIAAKVWAELVK